MHVTFVLCLSISSYERVNGAHKHGKQNDRHNSSTPPPPSHYNILSFGAVGDGVSDDSEVWEFYVDAFN